MIIDELDFFKEFLCKEIIDKYIEFNNEEDNNDNITINNCMLILSLYTRLKDNINVNSMEKKIFYRNLFNYLISVVLNFKRVYFYEVHIRSLFFQLREECEILELLEDVLKYSDEEEFDMKSNNVSRVFLLLNAMDEVKKRRVLLDKNINFLLENTYKDFRYNYYCPYDDKDIDIYLDKIKSYSRNLKKNS